MAKMKFRDTLEIDTLNPDGDGRVWVSLTERCKGVSLGVDIDFLRKVRDGLNDAEGDWQGDWFHARGGFGYGGHLAIGRTERECGREYCCVFLGDAHDVVSVTMKVEKLRRLLDKAFGELELIEYINTGKKNPDLPHTEDE